MADLTMNEECGEICETRRATSFEWKISNFLSMEHRVGTCCWSPNFALLDSYWHLQVFPKGETDMQLEDWIGVYLWRCDSGPSKIISFTLGIRNVDGKVEVLCEVQNITFTAYGHVNFLRRSELLRRQLELVPFGALTITCTIKSNQQQPDEVSFFKRLLNLSLSWKKVLDERGKTDVVLKLRGRDIACHSLVLKSRSTFFERMLSANANRRKVRVIQLMDEKADLMDIAISSMYYGEPNGLDCTNACEVHRIACKYELYELRMQCCKLIQENLSIESVCDVIAMPTIFEEAELAVQTKHFVSNNAIEIFQTDKWKALKRVKSVIVVQLLGSILLEKTI